jgi:hypothetical protein
MSADVVSTGTRFFTVHVVLPSNASDATPHSHSLSKSLTVKYKSQDTIHEIWKRSVRQFKRAYGIECPPGLYWSQMQTNEGGDLFMDDTVGELYRPDAPQAELQLRFVTAHNDEESSLPLNSALRPPGFRKREWTELTREEQHLARDIRRWTAINDPTPVSSASTQAGPSNAAARTDADGFKIPGRPSKTPRRTRAENIGTASQASASNSQATVLVADSQPARTHPPTPTSRPGSSQISSSQISSSQVSSNATPPSAQRPPDTQDTQPATAVHVPLEGEDFMMVDDDSSLDDELLQFESSQEQSNPPEASNPRTVHASSFRPAKASSSKTAVSSSSRTSGKGKVRLFTIAWFDTTDRS